MGESIIKYILIRKRKMEFDNTRLQKMRRIETGVIKQEVIQDKTMCSRIKWQDISINRTNILTVA